MVGKLPRKLSVQLVPAWHVMNQHNAWKWSGSQGSRIVRVDYLSVMARQHNGLGKHSLIHVSRVRVHGRADTLHVLKEFAPIRNASIASRELENVPGPSHLC